MRTSIPAILLPACLLAAHPTPADGQTAAQLASQRYDVDPMHSTIAFAAKIMGAVNVRGRFNDYDATIICDPAHPERSSVSAVIKASSVNTDMKFRDDHLRSPDFFGVEAFPLIEFTSDRVTPQRGGVRVSGMLTMHGVTRRISFPAKMVMAPHLAGTTPSVAFSAELRLSRKEFAIAGDNKFNPDYNPATDMVSDSVDILLELDAIRTQYTGRRLGTGTPPGVADTINRALLARGVTAAIDSWRALKSASPAAFRFSAGQLDVIGHQLEERHELHDAVAILSFNAREYGATPGVLESLAEAQALSNDAAAALATYRSALARFPSSTSAREMVRHLEVLVAPPTGAGQSSRQP